MRRRLPFFAALFAASLLGACDASDDAGPSDPDGGAGGKADDTRDDGEDGFDHASAFATCDADLDAATDAAQSTADLREASTEHVLCLRDANDKAAVALDDQLGVRETDGTGAVAAALGAYRERGGDLCEIVAAGAGFINSGAQLIVATCTASLETMIAEALQSYSSAGDWEQSVGRVCEAEELDAAAERLGDSVILLHEAVDGLDLPATTPTIDGMREAGHNACDSMYRSAKLESYALTCCQKANVEGLTLIIDSALE